MWAASDAQVLAYCDVDLSTDLAALRDDPQNATVTTTPAGLSVTDWAAYTLVARVLLNLDETITKG